MSEEIKLYCWVYGDPAGQIFPVQIQRSQVVAHLRKAIHTEKSNTFRGISAKLLRLYKVDIPLSSFDDNAAKTLEVNEDQRMIGTAGIGEYWSQQLPQRMLGVVVHRPDGISPSGTAKPGISQDNVSGRPTKRAKFNGALDTSSKLQSRDWYYDLWKPLWDSVNSHFPGLEQHTVSRDNTLNEVVVARTCAAIRDDLGVFPTMINGVMFRSDYLEVFRDLFSHIGWDASKIPRDFSDVDRFENPFWGASCVVKGHHSGFILTGQAGTGKSTWLYILLMLRLHAKLPTVFQSQARVAIFFDSDGVRRVDTANESEFFRFRDLYAPERTMHPWVLVDSNRDLRDVPTIYSQYRFFIVQTPSPRPERFEWTKKENIEPWRFILKQWSLEELILGRHFQQEPSSEALLRESHNLYGSSARVAYRTAHTPIYYKETISGVIASLTMEKLRYAITHTNLLDMRDDVSSSILQIDSDAVERHLHVVQFASDHIQNLVLTAMEKATANAGLSLYRIFLRSIYSRSAAGSILDRIMHDILPAGGVWDLLELEKSLSKGSENQHWRTPSSFDKFSECRLYVKDGQFSITSVLPNEIKGRILCLDITPQTTSLATTAYYRHALPNQPTFNGVLFDFDTKHAVIFQATVASKHDVNAAGISQILRLGATSLTFIAFTPRKSKIDLSFPTEVERKIGECYQLQFD